MLIGKTVEEQIWNYLLSAGLTEAGAAGLMDNLQAESGLKPDNLENLCERRLREAGVAYYTDDSYTAAVDSGLITRSEFLNPLPGNQYGYGIAQWTSPGRKAGLYDLVKSKGVSIADLETQLEYLVKELRGTYIAVWQVLIKTDSVREASDIVLKKFECPTDTSEAVCDFRALMGQVFYDRYGGRQTMSLISNCGHDENGGYSGGKAGDQTGTEWQLIPWYNRPWNCVLRHPDPAVRELHASMAKAAAENNMIGYDQGQRDSFGAQLKAAGDDPAKIKVKCETDCSKGIIDITKAIGRRTGRMELESINATYTGNMRSAYRTAGYQVLTDSKYLTGPDYLLPGDILLNDQHHVATNIQKGTKTETADTYTGGDYMFTVGLVQSGSTGNDVKLLQRLLKSNGCKGKDGKALSIDGSCGANTVHAIKTYQQKKGLEVDGSCGSATWGSILMR